MYFSSASFHQSLIASVSVRASFVVCIWHVVDLQMLQSSFLVYVFLSLAHFVFQLCGQPSVCVCFLLLLLSLSSAHRLINTLLHNQLHSSFYHFKNDCFFLRLNVHWILEHTHTLEKENLWHCMQYYLLLYLLHALDDEEEEDAKNYVIIKYIWWWWQWWWHDDSTAAATAAAPKYTRYNFFFRVFHSLVASCSSAFIKLLRDRLMMVGLLLYLMPLFWLLLLWVCVMVMLLLSCIESCTLLFRSSLNDDDDDNLLALMCTLFTCCVYTRFFFFGLSYYFSFFFRVHTNACQQANELANALAPMHISKFCNQLHRDSVRTSEKKTKKRKLRSSQSNGVYVHLKWRKLSECIYLNIKTTR